MARNVFNGVMPLILAVLIALAGFIVPQKLLSRQEKRIKSDEGTVDEKTFSILSYNTADSKERLLQLSEFISNLTDGENDVNITKREPLDEELSFDEAAEAADVFLKAFLSCMESYGLPVYDIFSIYSYKDSTPSEAKTADRSTSSASAGSEASAGSDYVTANLYSSVIDASLSFWLVERDGFSIVLDSITGTPIKIMFYTYVSSEILPVEDGEDLFAIISLACGEVYNDIYSFSFLPEPVLVTSAQFEAYRYWEFEQTSNDGCKLMSDITVEEVFDEGCLFRTDLWLNE